MNKIIILIIFILSYGYTASVVELIRNIENKSFKLKYYFWTSKGSDVFLMKKRSTSSSLWAYTKDRKWRPLHNTGAFDGYDKEDRHFKNIKYDNGNVIFSKLIDEKMSLEVLKINKVIENKTYKIGYYFWQGDNNTFYLMRENNDTSKSIWNYTKNRKWRPIHNSDTFDGFMGAGKTIQNIVFNKKESTLTLGNTDVTLLDDIRSISDIQEEPYYKYSWHQKPMDRLSFVSISNKSHMNIEKAWEITRGKGVIVAIIDTDFDIYHNDLAQNIKSSFNAKTRGSDVLPLNSGDSHGTAVAGVIGAAVNGIGIVGAAPESKMILINFPFTGPTSNIVKAFDYAQKSGAKIINCSWGGSYVSDIIKYKIQELYEEGIIVVFASGNSNVNVDHLNIGAESKIKTVLSVGATDENNVRAPYSNYGSSLDFVAPGGKYGVLTTDVTADKGINNTQNIVNNDYSFRTGTSFATPNASGVIALMVSVNPNITPDEVRNIIIKTADKIEGKYDDNGFSIELGYGKINAYKAVMGAKELNER